jgi:hypothetical protein
MSADYTLTGQIKNADGRPIADLLVEAFDDDFGTADDYLGKSFTDSEGKFEIPLEQKDYKSAYDVLEMNPDVYLVIYDEYEIIYKTETRSNADKNDLHFDLTLSSYSEPYDDPYATAVPAMISRFAAIGDTVTLSDVNLQRSIPQMLRSLNSFLHYTDPRVTRIYGYPGPQVIARPKDFPAHSHSIPWTEKSWQAFGHNPISQAGS